MLQDGVLGRQDFIFLCANRLELLKQKQFFLFFF